MGKQSTASRAKAAASKLKPRRSAASASFSPEEIAALEAARKRSESTNPAPVLDAFFPATIKVGDLALRPLTLGDFMLLEKLESPLLEEAEADSDEEPTTTDFALGVFVLALPPGHARGILTNGGREDLDRHVAAFADRIAAGEVVSLGLKVRAAIVAGFASMQPMGASDQKKTAAQTPASAGV